MGAVWLRASFGTDTRSPRIPSSVLTAALREIETGAFDMAKMSVEIEGSVAEVVRVIRRLGNAGQRAATGEVVRSMETAAVIGGQTTPAGGVKMPEAAEEGSAGEWTEALTGEFLAGLEPATRRVARHVCRGVASGVHLSALCQHMELTPRELSLLVMRMGRALRQFQRERGVVLSLSFAAVFDPVNHENNQGL